MVNFNFLNYKYIWSLISQVNGVIVIYRGSYMSGHLIWNLWNELYNFGILRAFGEQNTEITQRVS